jgi:drug/metabolite transporter (DMT)-like permease
LNTQSFAAMKSQVQLGVACALCAAGLYGLVPNFVRGAFNNGIPPVEATLFRTTVITLAFALLATLQGERLRVPREALAVFSGQAAATLIVSVSYLASVQFIPVGLAVIIFFTFPVLIMLVSPLVEGRSPGMWRILIAILAFIGITVAIGPSFAGLDLRGVGLATLASLGGAAQFFTGRSISRYMRPAVFGSLVHLAIWPATLLVALYVGNGTLQLLPGNAGTVPGLYFLVGVAAVYVVAYMLQMLSLRYAPASTVAPFYNLEPILTTVFAGLLFDERLTINQYAGGGIVLAALVISSLLPSQEAGA